MANIYFIQVLVEKNFFSKILQPWAKLLTHKHHHKYKALIFEKFHMIAHSCLVCHNKFCPGLQVHVQKAISQ
jgi:hypothetical protein